MNLTSQAGQNNQLVVQRQNANIRTQAVDGRRSFYGRSSIGSCVGNQIGVPNKKKFQARQAMKQLNQVIKNVRQVSQKNKGLFDKITEKMPTFYFCLFKINIPTYTIPQEQIKLVEQKLLRQLDKLYEQNCILQKQFNKMSFLEQNQEKAQEQSQESHLNHYQFLRNIWQNRLSLTKEMNSEEMLQKINKNVASIRNNIGQKLKKQNQAKNQPLTKKQAKQANNQDQFIIQSNKYKDLLRKFQHSQMMAEDKRSDADKNTKAINLQNETQSKQSKTQSYKQIESLQNRIKQLESQLLKSQRQALNCNEKIRQLDQQLKKYRKDDRYLRVVFESVEQKLPVLQAKHNKEESLPLFQIRIYDRDYFAESDCNKPKSLAPQQNSSINRRLIDCPVQDVLRVLEAKVNGQESHGNNNDDKLDISLTSIDNQSRRQSINARNSLTLIDMNKIIKTDRTSLLERSKQLSAMNEHDRPLRNLTNQKVGKENFLPFQLEVQQNCSNFEIPLHNVTIPEFKAQEENSSYMKTKFIRTSARTRRDSIR